MAWTKEQLNWYNSREAKGVINQLETVKSGTTAYPKAQQLLGSVQKKLEQVQPK